MAPSSEKAAYLAAHYLSIDRPSRSSSLSNVSKKRKRKGGATSASAASGLIIADDDDLGWGGGVDIGHPDDDEDPDAPVLVGVLKTAPSRGAFRKAKNSGWKTVGTASSTKKSSNDDAEAAAAADAILASAAAETVALGRDSDDDGDPGEIPMPAEPSGAFLLTNGTHAGLQSSAAIAAQLATRHASEAHQLIVLNAASCSSGHQQPEEIIVRDATGRRINLADRRAEMAAAATSAEQEALAREAAAKAILRGEVQAREARARKERLENAVAMPLARSKDDAEMNAEMKASRRWNDPMAQFMAEDDVRVGMGKEKRGALQARRPSYKGTAPPNRYGICPGYRWDGVDRGIGFEAERFKALNRQERAKNLEYSWRMDE